MNPMIFEPASLKGKKNITAFKNFLYERSLIENSIYKHKYEPTAVEVITEGILRKFKLNKDYQKNNLESTRILSGKGNGSGNGNGNGRKESSQKYPSREVIDGYENQRERERKRAKNSFEEEENYDQTVKKLMKASIALD